MEIEMSKIDSFKVIPIGVNDAYYSVIPTAYHLKKYLNKFEFPYDTNWEIYKLYNYTPKQMAQYVIAKFGAIVGLSLEYPLMIIRFDDIARAEAFKNELEEKFSEFQRKNSMQA